MDSLRNLTDRPAVRFPPAILASPAALKLYERAKTNLKPGMVIVFGSDPHATRAVERQLRRGRSHAVFDQAPYEDVLARHERLHPPTPHSVEEGNTLRQKLYTLLFEFPEDPYSVMIRSAVFLRGWEEDLMLMWCHRKLEFLARAIVDENDDGIAFAKIPSHAV